jgi:hypothetical protein
MSASYLLLLLVIVTWPTGILKRKFNERKCPRRTPIPSFSKIGLRTGLMQRNKVR